MVYLEGASRGLPSIALRNMGVPRVVEDGRTGLLAEPPDADAYAQALTRAISDKGLRKQLGAGARQFVETERSGKQAASQLRSIIDGVLEKTP